MAYLYGKEGKLDRLTEAEARAQLEAAEFGVAAQALTKAGVDAAPGVFDDVDFIHGDHLTYSAAQADGSPLPAWLNFDAATGIFSGTPGGRDGGEIEVAVTATDTGGLSARALFTIDVATLNTAPVTVADINDGAREDGAAVSGNVLSNDHDVDAGTVLAVAAPGTVAGTYGDLQLAADGGYVYAIHNDEVVQSLGRATVVTDRFNYAATDGIASTPGTLDVVVRGANDAPQVAAPLDGQTVMPGTAWTWTLPDGSFMDIDQGDALAYDAKLADGSALPSWLSFDPATLTFSGTVPATARGAFDIRVTAEDRVGATGDMTGSLSASSVFTLALQRLPNQAPVAFDDAVAVSEDGVRRFAGNALSNDSDPEGSPLRVTDAGSQAGTYGSLSLAGNGDFTYVLANDSIAVQSLPEGAVVTERFGYNATDDDSSGALSAGAAIVVSVSGTNDAPVTVADSNNDASEDGAAVSGNMLGNDSDIDAGTVLQVVAPGEMAGTYGRLQLAANGAYAYATNDGDVAVQSLGRGAVASDHFAYAASDGLTSTPGTLDVAVHGVNDAPQVAMPLADQAATPMQAWTWTLPEGSFTDVDQGDVLAYGAKLADGSPLPGWLSFDPATRTFGGTAPVTAMGNFDIRVTAEDRVGATGDTTGSLSASDVFRLSMLRAPNQAPLAADDVVATGEDGVQRVTGNVLANDRDPEGLPLRIADAGSRTGTYGSLSLAGNGEFTYTLANDAVAVQSLPAGTVVTERFGYNATDDDPDGALSASAAIVVSVTGANDAPVTVADANNDAREDGAAVNGNVLRNDSDVDAGTVLRVAAPGTQSGTYGRLTLAADGGYTYAVNNTAATMQALGRQAVVTEHFAYAASDGVASTAGALDIKVHGANDAPILVAPLADQTAKKSKSWSWTVPASSFKDVDQGDTLVYSARLSNGNALPSWLSFNATTRTFCGTVPRNASGSLDIKVVAEDRVAATGSSAGSLSTSDVFRLTFKTNNGHDDDHEDDHGDGHGNEGVGNGDDPPPPGHDENENDGPGSLPGNPGSSGGHRRGLAPTSTALPDDEPSVLAGGDGRQPARPFLRADDLATASRDFGREDETVAHGDGIGTFARWLALDLALAEDQARRSGPLWLDGADTVGGAASWLRDAAVLGGGARGPDAFSLAAAAPGLKTFQGLGQGAERIV